MRFSSLAAGYLVALTTAVSSHAQATAYTFVNESLAGSPTGINDSGQVVGYYFDSSGNHYGFLQTAGSYTTLNDPMGFNSFASGINNAGQVVGTYVAYDGSGSNGFLYTSGTFKNIDDPLGTTGTGPASINDLGQIAGSYSTNAPTDYIHGFVYSAGKYTTVDDPLGTDGTVVTGINNFGQIAGVYTVGLAQYGFVDTSGVFTTLTGPPGTNSTPPFIQVTGINDTGELAGYYTDASGKFHGFVYLDGTYTTVGDPLGTKRTYIDGVNDLGQLVGMYINTDDTEGYFVATPVATAVPEPTSLAVLGTGIVLLIVPGALRKMSAKRIRTL